MKTAFVPNARDALQLIKLIPAVIITDVRNRAGVTGEGELLALKRIMMLPLVEKLFQFGPIGDPHVRPNWEVRLIWSIRLAHGLAL
jgi:hypothetical protein